jgi:hypothetical protein
MEQATWDWVLNTAGDGKIIAPEMTKNIADSLHYLLNNNYISYELKGVYRLTDEGLNRKDAFEKELAVLSKGIPLSTSRELTPKSSLLKRGFDYVLWQRSVTSNKKWFITDKRIIVGGYQLFLKYTPKVDGLRLYYFPASRKLRELVSKLTVAVYPLKREPVAPFCYQRLKLADPGVIWFKHSLTKELYGMPTVYYDYLISYSARCEFEHKISICDFHGRNYFLVDSQFAATKYKFFGNMIAILSVVRDANLVLS